MGLDLELSESKLELSKESRLEDAEPSILLSTS